MAINVPPETYYVELFGSLLGSGELNEVVREIRAGRPSVVVSGLTGSARALVLAALGFGFKPRPYDLILMGFVTVFSLVSVSLYLVEWVRHMSTIETM